MLNSYYQNSYTPQPKNNFLNNNMQTPSKQMSLFLSDTNQNNHKFGFNLYNVVERKIQNEQLNKEDLSYPIFYKIPTIIDELGKKRNCHSINTLSLYLPFSIDELHALYEMAENNEKVENLKLPMWTALVSKGKEDVYRKMGNFKRYEDTTDKNEMMIYDEWKRKKGYNMENTFEAMNRKVEININRRDNMNRGGVANPFLNNNNNNNNTYNSNNNSVNTFNPFQVKSNLTNVFNNMPNSNYDNNNNYAGTYNNNQIRTNQGTTNSNSFYNPFLSSNNNNNNLNTNNNSTTNPFNPFANNNNNYSSINNNNNNQVSSVTNPFLTSSSLNNINNNTNIFNPFLKNNSTVSNNPFTTNYNNNTQQSTVYNPFSQNQINTQTNPFISNSTPVINQQPQTTQNPFINNPFAINSTQNQINQIQSSITNPFALPLPSPVISTPINNSFYQTQSTNNSFLTPIKNTNYNNINPYYSASNPYYVMPVSFVLPTNVTTTMFTPSKQLTSKEYEDILNKAQLTYSQPSLKDQLSENEVEIKEIRQDSFILSSLKKKKKTVNSQTQSVTYVSSADIYWNRKMKGSLSYYSVNRNKLKSPSKAFDINEFIAKFKHEDNKHTNDVIKEEEIETDSKKRKIEQTRNIIYNLLCKVSFTNSNNNSDNDLNPINISLKYTNANIKIDNLKTDLINSIKCISSKKDIHIEHDNIEFKQSFLNSQEIDFSKMETTNQCYENLTEIKIFNVECNINLIKKNIKHINIDFSSENQKVFENKVQKCKYKITNEIPEVNGIPQTQKEHIVLENDKVKINFLQPINPSNINFDCIIADNKTLTIKIIDDGSFHKEKLKQTQIKFNILFKDIFIDETEEAFLKNIVEPCLNNLNTETFDYDSKKGELQIKNLNLNDFL